MLIVYILKRWVYNLPPDIQILMMKSEPKTRLAHL